MPEEEVEEFLEHFGVKGMKWGVRNDKKRAAADKRRTKGMGPRQLSRENQRVRAAGGGLRGTIRVRREMIRSGELSKEQARRGAMGFGRNVALGLLAGASIGFSGVAIARSVKARAGRRAAARILNQTRNLRDPKLFGGGAEFVARGKDFSVETNNLKAFETTMRILNERRR